MEPLAEEELQPCLSIELDHAGQAVPNDIALVMMTATSKSEESHAPSVSNYNSSLRILGISIAIGVVLAFCPSIYRFLDDGEWLNNPIPGEIPHPSQDVLSGHVLSALFWTILCTLQVVLGSILSIKGSQWFGKKLHRFMGRYILPPVILATLITALMILFNESSEGRVHPTFVILEVQACFMITIWAGLGYYFVFTKQYLRHKDCMIAVFLSTFDPALVRLARCTFQLSYYAVHSEFCLDVNAYPYIMVMAIVFVGTFAVLMATRGRLSRKEPHNVLFLIGSLWVLIFPCISMDVNWDPCAFVNLPHIGMTGVII